MTEAAQPTPPKFDAAKPASNPLNQLPQAAAPKAKIPAPSLMGTIKESQYLIREYTIYIPAGHTPENLSEPTYWVHHAARLSIHDKIDCISETGQWEVTLRVVNKGNGWVKMRLLSGYDAQGRDETVEPLAAQFKTDFVPSAKHRVIHKESGVVVSSGHPSKDAAIEALEAHVATLSRKQ